MFAAFLGYFIKRLGYLIKRHLEFQKTLNSSPWPSLEFINPMGKCDCAALTSGLIKCST